MSEDIDRKAENRMRKNFRAPWGTKLWVMTVVVLGILAVVLVTAKGWTVLLLLGIVGLAMAYAVRGYSVTDSQLLILRLGWATKFDLADLSSIEFSPGATLGSIRTMGIGGLFGFVGHFHNEILGSYRAYATNEDNTVVLSFSSQKIVITPDSPAEFVEAVTAVRPDLA